MHVLIILSDTQRSMFIAKSKGRLKLTIQLAQRHGWAWRYHDGSGWADGSDEAWKVIESITEPCMARIVY